jgi:hypothetical protein
MNKNYNPNILSMSLGNEFKKFIKTMGIAKFRLEALNQSEISNIYSYTVKDSRKVSNASTGMGLYHIDNNNQFITKDKSLIGVTFFYVIPVIVNNKPISEYDVGIIHGEVKKSSNIQFYNILTKTAFGVKSRVTNRVSGVALEKMLCQFNQNHPRRKDDVVKRHKMKSTEYKNSIIVEIEAGINNSYSQINKLNLQQLSLTEYESSTVKAVQEDDSRLKNILYLGELQTMVDDANKNFEAAKAKFEKTVGDNLSISLVEDELNDVLKKIKELKEKSEVLKARIVELNKNKERMRKDDVDLNFHTERKATVERLYKKMQDEFNLKKKSR